LVGCAGSIGDKEEKAFINLLQLDTIRGPHSTGVLIVNSNKHAAVHKELGTPWELMDSRKFEKGMNGVNNLLMGHNRFATKGAINVANAHPFMFENVIGAHNGTLTTQYGLDDWKEFDVDSENLYHHMNNNGVDDTIAKVNGAFALTWYDRKAQTINFIRNEQRPLFYAYSDDRKSLFWASEQWMLSVALSRNGVKIGQIQELAPLYLLSVPLNFGSAFVVKPFDGAAIRKLEGYRPPVHVKPALVAKKDDNVVTFSKNKAPQPFVDYAPHVREEVEFYVDHAGCTKYKQHYIQGYLCDNDKLAVRLYVLKDSVLWKEMMASKYTFTAKCISYVSDDNGYLVVNQGTLVENAIEANDVPEEAYQVFNNKEVDKAEYLRLVSKCGCAWCGHVATTAEAEDLVWISADDFVCEDCQSVPDVMTHMKLGAK
jgi:hypothetical protein